MVKKSGADATAVDMIRAAHEKLRAEYLQIDPASPEGAKYRAALSKVSATAEYLAARIDEIKASKESEVVTNGEI